MPKPYRLRILIVEDQPATRDSLAVFLADLGYWVESVSDAATALERSLQDGFDVLLTSLWLNNDTERSLLDKLQAQGKLPARVIATGLDPVEQALPRCRQAGCHAYLAKPFSPAELEAALW